MYRPFLTSALTAVLAAGLGGCESATGPEPSGSAPEGTTAVATYSREARSGHPVAHAVRLTFEGQSPGVGWCDETAGLPLVLVTAIGTMSHIGRWETEQTNCLDPATGALTDGQAVTSAANGDEIHMTYEGRVLPGVEPQTLELTYDVYGGTGRFARADGEFFVTVIYTGPDTFVGDGTGWLTYTASDRSDR